jgi:hypothetical protein
MSFSGVKIFTSGKVSNIECPQKVKLFERGYIFVPFFAYYTGIRRTSWDFLDEDAENLLPR